MADKTALEALHVDHASNMSNIEEAKWIEFNADGTVSAAHAVDSHLDADAKVIGRIRRRLDLRLATMLPALYIMAFLDRANLGNANIAGMGKDLQLTISNRYSVVAMIFFVGYALIDLPSPLAMKYVPAPLLIPSIGVAFGVITLGQGFIHHWGELAACRALLGLVEGALLPTSVLLLQVWYTRFEFQKRIALYYMVVIASSGLSGLLAYGIVKMDGTSGLEGWRWIFILEGVASCAVALVAFWALIDLPHRATQKSFFGRKAFLTQEEAVAHMAHIQRDRGDAETVNYGWRDMLYHMRELNVWEFSLILMFNNTALYAFNFFLPIILRQGLGYSPGRANLLTFPPFAAALPWMFAVAWFNDRYRTRGPSMIFNAVLYIIGVSIVAFKKNSSTRYGGVFLGVIGIAGNIPTQTAYQHSNTVGHARRAVCLGLMTMGGAVGGIISGNIFRAQDAPTYTPAICTCIAFQAVTILIIAKNIVVWGHRNRKADRGEMVIYDQPGFRYTL